MSPPSSPPRSAAAGGGSGARTPLPAPLGFPQSYALFSTGCEINLKKKKPKLPPEQRGARQDREAQVALTSKGLRGRHGRSPSGPPPPGSSWACPQQATGRKAAEKNPSACTGGDASVRGVPPRSPAPGAGRELGERFRFSCPGSWGWIRPHSGLLGSKKRCAPRSAPLRAGVLGSFNKKVIFLYALLKSQAGEGFFCTTWPADPRL